MRLTHITLKDFRKEHPSSFISGILFAYRTKPTTKNGALNRYSYSKPVEKPYLSETV
jgi:hypothetical protein